MLSVLLHYPDQDLLNGLDEIESLAANLPLIGNEIGHPGVYQRS